MKDKKYVTKILLVYPTLISISIKANPKMFLGGLKRMHKKKIDTTK